jgi:regulator of protease activity HflC (stomatin/prohibitin superfamily)
MNITLIILSVLGFFIFLLSAFFTVKTTNSSCGEIGKGIRQSGLQLKIPTIDRIAGH